MKVGEGLRTATLEETPESYVVARVGFGHVFEVVETLEAGPEGGKAAVERTYELRAQDVREHRAGERTLQALAVVHDCDAFAVPYVSDGPLGHGWECGRCGKFLQAG